jgi:sec-independent protein translocase protein TatB
MLDIGLTKIAVIGVVALLVIGPEKLPKVARIVGNLLGKAQRYVADVKAEVNRSMDLEELKKMQAEASSAMQDAGSQLQTSMSSVSKDFEDAWSQASNEALSSNHYMTPASEYKVPKKRWRAKVGAVPNWYKNRAGVKTHVLSGAARVARYRPKNTSI